MKSYKTICPECAGHNLYVTPDNGVEFCFNCKRYAKNGITTAIEGKGRSDHVNEIRAYYTELTDYYHSNVDHARNFLHMRGYTDTTIEKLKIGYIPAGKHPLYRNSISIEAGIADKQHNAFLGNRVAFPYFKTDTLVTDIRARAIDPHEDIKYKAPFGGAYYRGAIYPYNYNQVKKAKRVLLTEGEIKAGIALQSNFPTLGLPGILAWRQGLIQEEDQEYIIVFDNEIKPNVQRDVIYAIRKISLHLIDPKVAVLPILDGGNKAEVDTFINRYGVALFSSIIDNALDYDTWNALQTF